MDTIPYIAHEGGMARMERIIKRLWILCIVLIVLLVSTNIAWLIYEAQFTDEVKIEQEVDANDGDAYVSGIGDINYGESKADSD